MCIHTESEERKPKKRESPSLRPGASAPSAPFLDPDDEELARSGGGGGVGSNGLTYDRNVNSKSFMPLGMLALRPANARMTGGPDTLLARAMRETAQALDKAMLESRPRLGRLTDSQLKDLFVPECLASKGATGAKFLDSELRANVSGALTRQLRESARQISSDKAEFHLLNLQGVLFPGNKTQLRWDFIFYFKYFLSVRGLYTIVCVTIMDFGFRLSSDEWDDTTVLR